MRTVEVPQYREALHSLLGPVLKDMDVSHLQHFIERPKEAATLIKKLLNFGPNVLADALKFGAYEQGKKIVLPDNSKPVAAGEFNEALFVFGFGVQAAHPWRLQRCIRSSTMRMLLSEILGLSASDILNFCQKVRLSASHLDNEKRELLGLEPYPQPLESTEIRCPARQTVDGMFEALARLGCKCHGSRPGLGVSAGGRWRLSAEGAEGLEAFFRESTDLTLEGQRNLCKKYGGRMPNEAEILDMILARIIAAIILSRNPFEEIISTFLDRAEKFYDLIIRSSGGLCVRIFRGYGDDLFVSIRSAYMENNDHTPNCGTLVMF